ncbi:hypothetical protein M413DRAFT_19977 [Hebeloma cylindrosporum]|uniref:Aminotransferase class I/classII domain-containing protein n=1 Tax=Hebeloma cylindrosporum TaxID=76867 RepID=A0A0C3C599_HEBCY|nr:hypothetical protein M413DRAFT_19977 [Hebeloma cylindrosporum h7]
MSLLMDFTPNGYLSLSNSSVLRSHFLKKLSEAPDIGGSRLLMNRKEHTMLEACLADFFYAHTMLLFNSEFNANVSFFSCIPQPGDSIDERVGLRIGESSLFLFRESLYSIDGMFTPLREIADLLEKTFSLKKGYLVIDEAHATEIYGPQRRGCDMLLGLDRHFWKSFGCNWRSVFQDFKFTLNLLNPFLIDYSVVVVMTTLTQDYLLNYAQSLIYTTSLSYSNIVAADCSFDMLIDGTAQHPLMELWKISPALVSLPLHFQPPSTLMSGHPSPIIPVLHSTHVCSLVPPYALTLLALGINARPIMWPTVLKGKNHVCMCLHSGNIRDDIDHFVDGIVTWAEDTLKV